MTSLEEGSRAFAQEVQDTLNAVLVGDFEIVSRRVEGRDRYIVQPRDGQPIPICVDGSHLADLVVAIFLDLDRTGRYLKAVRSDFKLNSTLDRTPLLRLEYLADMRKEPIAHWQFHAERGAFSQLLARAHAHRPEQVKKPHDLSSVHLPVGGERFRPCLEDFLQVLVVDCGIDCRTGWEETLRRGRESWRRRQLGSVVRDVPSEAVRVLREMGWECTPPEVEVAENLKPLSVW